MDKISLIDIRCYPDDRGKLYVTECGKDLPFVVRRVYYITSVADPSVVRGLHSHKNLHQVMFCVGGSCDVTFDDGKERLTVTLGDPGKGVLVKPGVWREMSNFTVNATLMVLASEPYDENDYIRDYKQFIDHIHGCNE